MGRPRIAPWIGAVLLGMLTSTTAQAGGFFGIFSHRTADCDPHCQQPCPQCQNPPKKKKVCCLRPPLPPVAPVGISVAADPQAQLPDNSQDERLNKLDKDLSRLTVIVEQMLLQQQQQPSKPTVNATPQTRANDAVPPGPIPVSARITNGLPGIQQVSAPAPTTAPVR